jgi:hypothetical protein
MDCRNESGNYNISFWEAETDQEFFTGQQWNKSGNYKKPLSSGAN